MQRIRANNWLIWKTCFQYDQMFPHLHPPPRTSNSKLNPFLFYEDIILSQFHRITCYQGSTVSLVCILLSQCIDVKSIQDIFSVSRDETLDWEGEISSCSFIFQPLLASHTQHWRQPSNVISALTRLGET